MRNATVRLVRSQKGFHQWQLHGEGVSFTYVRCCLTGESPACCTGSSSTSPEGVADVAFVAMLGCHPNLNPQVLAPYVVPKHMLTYERSVGQTLADVKHSSPSHADLWFCSIQSGLIGDM